MSITADTLTDIRSEVKDFLESIMLYGAAGDDNTAADPSDTEMGNETFRDSIDEVDKSVADKITLSLRILTTELNGTTVREGGWFSQDILVVDTCDVADWSDSADMTSTINNTTFIKGTGALNLTKDATSSADVTVNKTTTSRDFTSKKLGLWLYIADATMLGNLAVSNCVTIRFGSGAGDYYEWQKDKADFAVGWNLITDLTSDNADSTTGTPVITACDYTYVGITATGSGITWSEGDLILDQLRLIYGILRTRNILSAVNKTDDFQLYLDTQMTISVTEV